MPEQSRTEWLFHDHHKQHTDHQGVCSSFASDGTTMSLHYHSFFPANLRASRGTVLLPQEVEGTDCPLTICLSPLSQTSFTTKAFTKLNLQYLDRKKQENDTSQRFLKISSRKLYTVNTNKF